MVIIIIIIIIIVIIIIIFIIIIIIIFITLKSGYKNLPTLVWKVMAQFQILAFTSHSNGV